MSSELPVISPTSLLFPTSIQPLIRVFTSAGVLAFPYADIVRITINPTAKVPEHPLETGATREDFIIYDPIEIELGLVLSPDYYQSTYANIKNYYNSATLLGVQTKVDFYRDFLIYEMPHDEGAEYFDTIAIGLKLREFKQVTTSTMISSNKPSNKPAVSRGTIQPVAPTPEQTQRISVLGGFVYKK